MTDNTPLLRVAPLGACNSATTQQQPPAAPVPASPAICCAVADPTRATAQQPPIRATTPATAAQQPSLKALARKVLDAQQAAQQARNNAPDVVADAQPRNNGLQQKQHPKPDAAAQRARLLHAAALENIDPAVIHCLDDADIEGCQYWSDTQLRVAARWHRDDPCALWKTGGRP